MAKIIKLPTTKPNKIAEVLDAVDSGKISKAMFVFEKDDDIEIARLSEDLDDLYLAMGVLEAAKNGIWDYVTGGA